MTRIREFVGCGDGYTEILEDNDNRPSYLKPKRNVTKEVEQEVRDLLDMSRTERFEALKQTVILQNCDHDTGHCFEVLEAPYISRFEVRDKKRLFASLPEKEQVALLLAPIISRYDRIGRTKTFVYERDRVGWLKPIFDKLSPEGQKQILDYQRESNKNLFQKFLGRLGGR